MRLRRGAAAVAAVALVVAGCAQGGNEIDIEVDEDLVPDTAQTGTVAVDGVPDVVGVAARGLDTPWGFDFLPDGRAVVTERNSGRVLIVAAPTSGEGEPAEPVVTGTMPGVQARGEGGLLGVALSPDFAADHLAYFYLTTRNDNRVVRASLEGDELGEPEVVLKGIPAARNHNGGGLLFAEDGNLFVSTGDAGRGQRAQNRKSLAGKILRITPDGKRPADNPIKGSLVWSLGHRNVEGMTFDADGNLFASEFGQDVADEVNLIEPRKNYGWPRWEGPVEIDPAAPGPDNPVVPAITRRPDDASWAGIAYFRGFLWAAALQGERVWRMKSADGTATDGRGFLEKEYGRLRAIAVAPNGRLWLSTSNKDGRGKPKQGDDQILLINP